MTRPTNQQMKELAILEVDIDDFIVLSGERIQTESDPTFYPFTHAVTLRLCPRDAARIGQEIITVSEVSLLIDCDLPKATQLPRPAAQLTLDGKSQQTQPTLF